MIACVTNVAEVRSAKFAGIALAVSARPKVAKASHSVVLEIVGCRLDRFRTHANEVLGLVLELDASLRADMLKQILPARSEVPVQLACILRQLDFRATCHCDRILVRAIVDRLHQGEVGFNVLIVAKNERVQRRMNGYVELHGALIFHPGHFVHGAGDNTPHKFGPRRLVYATLNDAG